MIEVKYFKSVNGQLDIAFSLPNHFAVSARGGSIKEEHTEVLTRAADALGADDITLDTVQEILIMHFLPNDSELDLGQLMQPVGGQAPLATVNEIFRELEL